MQASVREGSRVLVVRAWKALEKEKKFTRMRHTGNEQWPEKPNRFVELSPVGQVVNRKKKKLKYGRSTKYERREEGKSRYPTARERELFQSFMVGD